MALSTANASAYLPSAGQADPPWKYDVFLSFWGEDTDDFTSDLFDGLKNRRFKIFKERQDLEVGMAIPPSRLTAIEESRIAIVVLSPNYSYSPCCLDELLKIVQCKEDGKTIIIPLFYRVDPSDVRHHRGNFEEPFYNNKREFWQSEEKLRLWRAALREVANYSGFHSGDYKSDKHLVENIVGDVCSKVRPYRLNPFTFKPKKAEREWRHDVFLSFRGVDARYGFVSHLYDAFEKTGNIKTFMDEQVLGVGLAISLNLLMAIEESRFAIVVLSPNYATSPWCLDEVTHICQTMEGTDRILPVFYNVSPADVRHQSGSFGTAFRKHEENSRHSTQKVKQWRVALKQVASLKGWNAENFESETRLVNCIVKDVLDKVLHVQLLPTQMGFTVTSTKDFQVFESTRQSLNGLVKALIDYHVTIIGVYGVGGLGKTTMVKHVSEQAQEHGFFHKVISAVVSQSPNLRKIQAQLADHLGLIFEESETTTERAARLKRSIMRDRSRLLIFLDDIWDMIDLSCIGIPSPDELWEYNSKLIMTTRKLDVCHLMDSQASLPLNMLSNEDSWNFFVEELRMSFDESTYFYEVANEVARECAGVPLALISVARALGGKNLDEWIEAARRLKASPSVNRDDEGRMISCIELSYDYLRSDDAKSIFFLCCLFPEDEDINIEELVKYAIGNGLLEDVNTIQQARSRAKSVIKYLKASSLLLGSTKEGCVKMHDVVRGIAISITMTKDDPGFLVRAGCESMDWPKFNVQSYSAISLMRSGICKLPQELACSRLQVLLLQNNAGIYQIPESFFQSLNELRLLDLSSTSISSLPLSFSLLTNLQALFLDNCNNLTDISILGKLRKLEILSMRKFPLKELPEEVGDLTNLRMLDLSESENIGRIPFKVMSRWVKLEELYMQCNYKNWGSIVEGGVGEKSNAGFDELTGLRYLNVLKLRISDEKCLPANVSLSKNWVNFDICISREFPSRDCALQPYFPHHHSRTLTLSTAVNSLPDWFIKVVTERVEKLQYLKCEGLKNILMECERGRLHRLTFLAVVGPHINLEVLMETKTWVQHERVFENLKELHLLGVSCLQKLCVGELPPGSLCNLRVLNLKDCHDLVNELLPTNLWRRLQILEKLICEDMKGIEYVFGSYGMEQEQIILPKLREMKLWNLEKLISIWNGPAPNGVFCNLTSLSVSGCKKLKSLFTYDAAQYLVQLQDLSVSQCASLDRIIEPSKEAMNKKICFPKLKSLVLSYLPQLTRFCSTQSATIECSLLEHLHVQDCPHFTTSTSDFHSWKQFQVNDLRHLRTMIETHDHSNPSDRFNSNLIGCFILSCILVFLPNFH